MPSPSQGSSKTKEMPKPWRVRVTADWSQWLKVEDLLDFVELEIFTSDWRRLRLDDDDLLELQVSIMLSPQKEHRSSRGPAVYERFGLLRHDGIEESAEHCESGTPTSTT